MSLNKREDYNSDYNFSDYDYLEKISNDWAAAKPAEKKQEVTTFTKPPTILPSTNSKPYTGYQGYGGGYIVKNCKHKHTPVFTAQGITFWGDKKSELSLVNPSAADTLYIDCLNGMKTDGFMRINNQALKDIIDPAQYDLKAISIDWPDGGIPGMNPKFWLNIVPACKKLGIKNVYAFCIGGHGRTGTALALMALATGFKKTADDAIDFIRTAHCEEAIETKIQEDYLLNFAKLIKKAK